jgi:hypothetical protein
MDKKPWVIDNISTTDIDTSKSNMENSETKGTDIDDIKINTDQITRSDDIDLKHFDKQLEDDESQNVDIFKPKNIRVNIYVLKKS